MRIAVLQPSYFAGKCPDVAIAELLLRELEEKAERDSLVLLPEYSNAGGLSEVGRLCRCHGPQRRFFNAGLRPEAFAVLRQIEF